MVRKVTGCTSCLLFQVIEKISFGHGHRCSRLMIFRTTFFTWTICAGQSLALQPNMQLPALRRENKWSTFTAGSKFARETQPDTKGQERRDILCSYRSFWHSSFSSQKNDDTWKQKMLPVCYQSTAFLILNFSTVLPAIFIQPWGILGRWKKQNKTHQHFHGVKIRVSIPWRAWHLVWTYEYASQGRVW